MHSASQQEQNRMIVGNIGDLVEDLYIEVMPLPLSDQAKHAMVMVIAGNCLQGSRDTFCFKPLVQKVEPH